MKIVSIINVSNLQDLNADSGVIFQLMLANGLSNLGVSLCIVGPPTKAFVQMPIPGCSKAFLQFGSNKYAVRFHFDWNAVLALIEAQQPDIIFVNQIELASHFRAVLTQINGKAVQLISYCHYIPILTPALRLDGMEVDPSQNDNSLGHAIVLKMAAGIVASDIVLVQSDYAASLLNDIMAGLGIDRRNRVHVLSPPLDPAFLVSSVPPRPGNTRIVYNHRLYEHYGTAAAIDLLSSVACECDAHIIVTDLTAHRSTERARLDTSVDLYKRRLRDLPFVQIVGGSTTRAQYRGFVASCCAGLAPLRRGAVWSMACVDCMGLGVPVVAPRWASFPEFIPHQLLFDSTDSARVLFRKLLTDRAFWEETSEACIAAVQQLHPRVIARQFIEIVRSSGV